jgi:hypothetical protein
MENSQDLKEIKNEMKQINEKLEKMSQHIDFIQKVYSGMKYPIDYICNKIPGAQPSLPPTK